MTETEDEDVPQPTEDIPSIVPDENAPLTGEDIPDDWLDPKPTTPSGR